MINRNSKRLLAFSLTAIMVLAIVPAANSAYATPASRSLILLIDCSGSISPANFGLMVGAYNAAFNDPAVIAALTSGTGTAVEAIAFGASNGVIVPWSHITNAADSIAFGAAIGAFTQASCPGGTSATDMDGAINTAVIEFGTNPHAGGTKIIDLTTDGFPSNAAATTAAAAAAQAAGVTTLNALGIGPGASLPYLSSIIFGPMSFANLVPDFAAFQQAILDKIILETTPVAGIILPINTIALLLAGVQSSMIWLVPAIAGVIGTGFYFTKGHWNKSED